MEFRVYSFVLAVHGYNVCDLYVVTCPPFDTILGMFFDNNVAVGTRIP